jgi:hypothetical protein
MVLTSQARETAISALQTFSSIGSSADAGFEAGRHPYAIAGDSA